MQTLFLTRRFVRYLLLILLSTVLLPSLGIAEPVISKIGIKKNVLYLSTVGSLKDIIDIQSIIEDGINPKIIYTINLYKKGSFLIPEELITNMVYLFSMKKDLINNGYICNLSIGEEIRGRWLPDMRQLTDYVQSLNNIRIIDSESLSTENLYYLDIQQQVISLDLYPPLSLIYNLIGNWNYTSRKVRSPYFNRNGIINE